VFEANLPLLILPCLLVVVVVAAAEGLVEVAVEVVEEVCCRVAEEEHSILVAVTTEVVVGIEAGEEVGVVVGLERIVVEEVASGTTAGSGAAWRAETLVVDVDACCCVGASFAAQWTMQWVDQEEVGYSMVVVAAAGSTRQDHCRCSPSTTWPSLSFLVHARSILCYV
jgi:hypothetical protein